jgi:uncharacterized protein DUF3310
MTKEPEHIAADGTVRKDHYGAGRQPWDDIVHLGWAPEFAAGNALKYVRRHRDKGGEDDLEKGRWYYARLMDMAMPHAPTTPRGLRAPVVFLDLNDVLTAEEKFLLLPMPKGSRT